MPPRTTRATPPCDPDTCRQWFATQLPDHWFGSVPALRIDKDEILVVGELAVHESPGDTDTDTDSPAIPRRATIEATVNDFRDATRAARIQIADAAQHRWGRAVSWAVRCEGTEFHFTTQAVPVMTRLRMDDRQVLDTLIDAGVARSRSEALAWCVHQVGQHQDAWITKLRGAMAEVERIRAEGPGA